MTTPAPDTERWAKYVAAKRSSICDQARCQTLFDQWWHPIKAECLRTPVKPDEAKKRIAEAIR